MHIHINIYVQIKLECSNYLIVSAYKKQNTVYQHRFILQNKIIYIVICLKMKLNFKFMIILTFNRLQNFTKITKAIKKTKIEE